MTNKLARPRANAVSIPNEIAEPVKQDIQREVSRIHRRLSISRYLEEISKIGANGTLQSNTSMEPVEAEISPGLLDAATGTDELAAAAAASLEHDMNGRLRAPLILPIHERHELGPSRHLP